MKMPASFAEFSDALQKARIKDGSFCKNELTCIHYNGLTHAMIGWNANLYDLNLFAQRLASLTEEQKKGMDALLKIKQNHRVAPIPLNQLITLDGIKSKTVGDGQHGTARWATKQEIRQTYAHVPFEPELWRKGEHLPEKQGLVLGCEGPKDHVIPPRMPSIRRWCRRRRLPTLR